MIPDSTIINMRVGLDRFGIYFTAFLVFLACVFAIMYAIYQWSERKEAQRKFMRTFPKHDPNKQVPLQIFRNGKWEDM